jgi:exosome complex component RRP42
MIIPKIQKQRIIEYIKQGKRFDNRAFDKFRKIEIKTGISLNAEGSASVKIGKTEVYAGVKMDVMEPYSDGPSDGTLTVGFEMSPIASPDFDMGPPSIKAIEAGRVIDRGIRESGLIEFDKLCIKEGEKVWGIYLDIYALNDSGNLIDAASLAALAALADAKIPVYDTKEGKVDRHQQLTDNRLPLNKESMSLNLTFHKIDGKIILDPTREEEEVSEYRISIAFSSHKGKPRISSIQKGEEGAISFEEMENILNLLEVKFKEMYEEIQKQIFKK